MTGMYAHGVGGPRTAQSVLISLGEKVLPLDRTMSTHHLVRSYEWTDWFV